MAKRLGDDMSVISTEESPVMDTADQQMSAPAQSGNFTGGMMASMMQSPAMIREMTQVLARSQMALMRPRNIDEVKKKVQLECVRPELAENAVYRYARGGTEIKGPSIRLAECIARAYRNITYGNEILSDDGESAIIRAYAFDLEANIQAERIFRVEHVRDNGVILTSGRDKYENEANLAQRRVRACILELIPGDIVDLAMHIVGNTMDKYMKVTPEKITKIIQVFEEYGVTQKMLEAFVQRRIDAITSDQLKRLRQIAMSLADGISEPADFFDLSLTEEEAKPVQPAPEKKKASKPAKALPSKAAEPDIPAPQREIPEPVRSKPAPATKPEPQPMVQEELISSEEDLLAAEAAFDSATTGEEYEEI